MDTIPSKIQAGTPEFQANQADMQQRVDDLKTRLKKAHQGGGQDSIDRHRSRGKLFVRDRVEALLDPGTPFLEICALAAEGIHDAPAAGMVTGIGQVCGRPVMIVANDATVKGGTYFPQTVKKHLRAQEIARENHLPCIYLVDSGGAFLPLQAEVSRTATILEESFTTRPRCRP